MAKDDQYTPTPKIPEEIKPEVLLETQQEVPTDVINDENKSAEADDASTIPPTD